MNLPPRHTAPPDRLRDDARLGDVEATRRAPLIARPKAGSAIMDLGPATAGANEAFVALRLRQISDRSGALFGEALLANPAWDILLDLFVRRSEGRSITLQALCDAASAPDATVMRYLNALDDAGLVICGSGGDVASPLITLTDEAFEKMKAVLA